VLVNTSGADSGPNVVLMTHIPSAAALEPNKERDKRLEAETRKLIAEKREDELVAGYEKMRTFVDDGLWQEVKFVP
jgi:hypothetical protein